MTAVRTVYLVVPDGIDDLSRPSGGNTYDRRLRHGLEAGGWTVRTVAVPGAWPWAGEAGRRAMADALSTVPDGCAVLVDGLVASTVPEVLVPAAHRLPVVVLVHMPIGLAADHGEGRAREQAVLEAAHAVVTTSGWTRRWLLEAYGLDPERLHVAHPGVDPAAPAPGTPDGGRLLCVGAVTPGKGHDLLLAALGLVVDLPWRCDCVGSLSVAPDFAADLQQEARTAGLGDRMVLTGPLSGQALEAAYDDADLLVLASRGESYGMVVTEALARGIPVLATHVGGLPEALGMTPAGRPGLLTPPGDVFALASSLKRWLTDGGLRRRLREAAGERRAALAGWPETADRVSRVLGEVA